MRTGIATVPLDYNKISPQSYPKIPNEPKIPLRNYLLDLVADSDGKESSVYLKGVEKFIQEIWSEMIQSNWRILRVRKLIPEKLGVHHVLLYGYKNGKKAIPIQSLHKLLLLWKEYCHKNNEDIKRKWEEIYASNFTFSVHKSLQPTKLPKYFSPKLSYFVGWTCGDGHLTDYGNHYLIKISEESIEELSLLQTLVKDLFGINPPIFRIYKNGYALQFGNKPVFRFLTQVLKIKVGEFPEIIKEVNDACKKYFLAGVFDSEGCVYESRYRITISQANLRFLEKIIALSNELGIKFRDPVTHRTKLGIWYTIRIDKKDDILKFANSIGSYHVNKYKKLKKQIAKIYENRNS
jgi:hypothetical protein